MVIKDWLFKLLGFNRNSKYVNKHINDANIRSSIYMSSIIVILEIWMIIRSTNKYVIEDMKTMSWFDAQFKNTSLFILFAIAGIAMLLFAIYYLKSNSIETKRGKIIPLVSSGILIVFTLFIFKELQGDNFKKWGDSNYYNVSNLGVIFFYFFALLLGIAILGHAIYKMIYKKNNTILSIVVNSFLTQ